MENISRYIIRASFSTERLNYISESSRVIYKSKTGNDTKEFDAVDFIASLCSHIPNQNEQTVFYKRVPIDFIIPVQKNPYATP